MPLESTIKKPLSDAPIVEGGAEAPPFTARAVVYLRVSTPRQASKNGEAEGYSIPQQRDYCFHKAEQLGATVVEEFVDAGASARSANRPELQRMLALLAETARDPSLPRVDYVIVHKLDRLARDRGDDVAIVFAIRNAGATLVSVAEQVDETPSGMLMHGIIATVSEYYSRNLSYEAKKGMERKAKLGGTHGVAPIGYLNTITRNAGIEVRTVQVDEERADHIRWAFTEYATGRWSVASMADALAERGLKSRATKKYVGTPLNEAQVHRMLHSVYYIGKIVYQGMILDGAHEPLIPSELWFRVQDVLSGRRIAGDRSWRHTHYLKGSLVCGRCGSRMSYGTSRGKGGTYEYFFCLGRHTKRTSCKLPYVPVAAVEKEVERQWRIKVQFDQTLLTAAAEHTDAELDAYFLTAQKQADQQRRRLISLERSKQKLIDAYMADAIPIADLKARQLDIAREIADAEHQIQQHSGDRELVRERLDTVLALARVAGDLYQHSSDDTRQRLNQAVFDYLAIDYTDDNGEPLNEAAYTGRPAVSGALSAPVQATRDFAANLAHTPAHAATPANGAALNSRTPGRLAPTGGSNVDHLAVPVGFESGDGARRINESSDWQWFRST